MARFAKSEAKKRVTRAPQIGPPAARAKPPRQSVLEEMSAGRGSDGVREEGKGPGRLGWEIRKRLRENLLSTVVDMSC